VLIFYVLICIASFALRSLVSLSIHNWCQDINLTSLDYFMNGGRWHAVPDQEIDADAVMQNCLEFEAKRDILEGALTYKIQRKHVKYVQDESEHFWLLVAWYGEHTKGLHVRAFLVDNHKRLDEGRLKRLYQKYWPSLKEQTDATRRDWALDDATKLVTRIKIMNGGYRWDIYISEEEK
jgi:hypothetical protein